MDFQELGLTLKRERENKGLTIEMVMEATKISRSNIVAMENGDRASLPHPVYAKGFVKSYARYLGMDAEELSLVVDQEYQDQANGPEEHIYEVSPAAEKAFQDGGEMDSKRKSKWPTLLILVLLLIGAAIFFFNMNGMDEQQDQTPEVSMEQKNENVAPQMEQPEPVAPAEEIASEEVVSDEEFGVDASAEADVTPNASDEQAVVEDEEQVVAATEPDQSAVEVQEDAAPAQTAATPAEPAQREVVEAEDPKYAHVLVVQATTDKGCWVGVWKGDEARMSRDFVLQKGEPLRLMFNTPRRIRIGNVAGVTVTYNGAPYELNKSKSNIQTLRFGQ